MKNREIKFRAWDTRKQRMLIWGKINVSPVMTNENATVVYERQGEEWRPNGDLELMQFTGLLDKNGKEIYEGDFLIDNDSEPMRHRIVWISDQAKFEIETLADEEGNWECLIVDSLGELVNGKNNVVDGFEIIGNIYENPELTPQSDE